jgi:hypothetical protein
MTLSLAFSIELFLVRIGGFRQSSHNLRFLRLFPNYYGSGRILPVALTALITMEG